METIQDYQKRFNHIVRYCKSQIYKREIVLEKYINNINSCKLKAEIDIYKDVLYKLEYNREPITIEEAIKKLEE